MKKITLACLAVIVAGLGACETTPTDPDPNPPAATISFKQGASYEFTSYRTSPSTGAKDNASERRRVWSMANTSASVYGRSNVAIFVDSVFSAGIFTLADTVYLQQQSGSNDIYRYASLAPELDIAGTSVIDVNFGKGWMHESRLNATAARWFVGEVADTVQLDLSVPALQGVKIAVTDSATASSTEDITINGVSYPSTKTTHKLELSVSAIITLPIVGTTAVKLKSESLTRTSWTSATLGAIIKEEREGGVIDVSSGTYGGVNIPGFNLDVPGYVSVMTRVIASGN